MRLRLGRDVQPLGEARGGGRRWQRAAVDALHVPAGGQLAQVAPHRVLGHAERDHELGGDDLAVALEAAEDLLAALGGQHPCGL